MRGPYDDPLSGANRRPYAPRRIPSNGCRESFLLRDFRGGLIERTKLKPDQEREIVRLYRAYYGVACEMGGGTVQRLPIYRLPCGSATRLVSVLASP